MDMELARVGLRFPPGSQAHPIPPQKLQHRGLRVCSAPLQLDFPLFSAWKADDVDLLRGPPCLQAPLRLGQGEARALRGKAKL